MYGYAIENTNNNDYMPVSYSLSQELVRVASEYRKNGTFKSAGPDMKSQVTIKGGSDGRFTIDTMLMSIQHSKDYNEKEFKDFIENKIMKKVAKDHNLNTDFKILINPTGIFNIGGPVGDAGLTGRKIIVDTYGGQGRHGGGAFSGKDATKMDRSGAYVARYIAKNIVASGIAKEAEVQLSYAIGVAQPISVNISTFDTRNKDVKYDDLIKVIQDNFDLSPNGVIKMLNLKNTIYSDFSCYGHFGRQDLKVEAP
jgi:S-adenosylmethionine synthetase